MANPARIILSRKGFDSAAYHHHLNADWPHNTVYIASDRLEIGGAPSVLPGAGVFRYFHSDLQLTATGETRCSRWSLPGWIYPGKERRPLSYHPRSRWSRSGDTTHLQSVGRGQEFALHTEDYPESLPWVRKLIETHGR